MSESAAYFDVDGTLVDSNLLHPTWMYLSNQATPWQSATRLGKALLSGPAMALAELRDRRTFNEMLFSHYAGMTEDRLVVLADEVFETMMKPRIFPGTVDLIKKTQEAGQRIVLITGSLDLTIRPLAAHLGIPFDDCITNRLEMKNRVATGKLMRPVVAGPTKARLIAEDARAHGHDLTRCLAYSDSFSDVPMLSVVGHPYVVHPDSRLQRLADAYSWPVLDLKRPARESHRARA